MLPNEGRVVNEILRRSAISFEHVYVYDVCYEIHTKPHTIQIKVPDCEK